MRGLPDWGAPVDRDGVGLYAAFETDGVAIALPDTLTIADDGGCPAFRLTAIRPLVPMPGRRGHGRLNLELRLTSGAQTADGAIRAAPPLRGWLRLRASMLDLPPALDDPIALDCSGLGLARLTLPLEADGVAMIEAALAEGATPILAHVDVEIAGMAPRLPAQAAIDLALLRAVLADDTMTHAALIEKATLDPAAIGAVPANVPADLPPRRLAEGLVDHIRARLCDGPLAPAGDAGLALVLADHDIAVGTATLDLSLPVIATRPVAVALDPFASARSLSATLGGIAALVTRGQSGLLPTGRYEVIVDDSVRRPCIGPLAMGATLTFPARPPARAHAVVEDFELPTSGDSVIRAVRLAPGEPLAWTLAGFAFWPTPDGRGVARLDGGAVDGEGVRALLRPDAFPLSFVDVEAGDALLALAGVDIILSGARADGTTCAARATLDAATSRVSLAVPADATARLGGTLIAREGTDRIPLPDRPAADWRIELADLPGYGPRAIELNVTLSPGVALLAIEVLAEDAPADTAPETYAFTPAAPTRTHRWLCRDPFRPGIRWRRRGETSYSAPVSAARIDLAPEVLSA